MKRSIELMRYKNGVSDDCFSIFILHKLTGLNNSLRYLNYILNLN